MGVVIDQEVIKKSRAEVFGFVADLTNLPKWQSEVVESTVTTPGPLRAGTRFTEQVKVGRRHVPAECEVTTFLPDERFGFIASSPAVDFRGEFVFTDAGAGTQVEVTASFTMKGLFRLLAPVFGGEARRGVRHELESLNRILAA